MSRRVKAILSRRSLALGSLIVLAFLFVAAAAPLLAPPTDEDNPYLIPREGFGGLPEPPSREHPLGKLPQQYDIYYGLVWGTRTALKFGLFVALGRLIVGALLGLISGYYGKAVDAVIMRLTDAFLAFPIVAAVMVASALFARDLGTSSIGIMFLVPSRGEQVVIVTLVLFGWMAYARLLRGNVLAEREKEYMHAATALGAGGRRVMFRHLLPNVTPGLLVLVASDIGAVVVLVATLAFIGLVPAPMGQMEADWGQMLVASRNWIIGSPLHAFEHWYTYIPVSTAVVLFSAGWNLMGDGLREVLDPRMRRGSPRSRVGG
jgi:peptide/nickel transport system permease protein